MYSIVFFSFGMYIVSHLLCVDMEIVGVELDKDGNYNPTTIRDTWQYLYNPSPLYAAVFTDAK